jgi:hypothetical protein
MNKLRRSVLIFWTIFFLIKECYQVIEQVCLFILRCKNLYRIGLWFCFLLGFLCYLICICCSSNFHLLFLPRKFPVLVHYIWKKHVFFEEIILDHLKWRIKILSQIFAPNYSSFKMSDEWKVFVPPHFILCLVLQCLLQSNHHGTNFGWSFFSLSLSHFLHTMQKSWKIFAIIFTKVSMISIK